MRLPAMTAYGLRTAPAWECSRMTPALRGRATQRLADLPVSRTAHAAGSGCAPSRSSDCSMGAAGAVWSG
ncbi:hypothetical protein, partial [Streptomyces sp. KR55]|uniref:hypothetical protein n=1 Tax=Streptomyces sp. KR55 TaxID=3457425 RepID=UPI003FD64FA6